MKKRIAIIGIDGSNKSGLARKLSSRDKKSTVIELTKYNPEHSTFYAIGNAFDKIIQIGEKKKSKKLVTAGYLGHSLLFGPYRLVAEKGKETAYFVRYPPIDAKVLRKMYMPGKAGAVLGKVANVMSAAPKPDSILLMDLPPEEALKRIQKRGKSVQLHENLDDLRKMGKAYSEIAEEAKKKGIKVFLVDAMK